LPINKKRKVGPKTVNCVFLGYASHCIAYRFLVVKSKVDDMGVGTIFESRDVTFFEDIFPILQNIAAGNPALPSPLRPQVVRVVGFR
jgi:hypothetical protein